MHLAAAGGLSQASSSMDAMDAADITELLKQASAQLRIGEMIEAEGFDLGKIMNAVEIGDPRLDAGTCSGPRENFLQLRQTSMIGPSDRHTEKLFQIHAKDDILSGQEVHRGSSEVLPPGTGARQVDNATESSQMQDLPVELDLRQQASIMSHMLILEATWFNGSNLAQTVYTCRYLLEHNK